MTPEERLHLEAVEAAGSSVRWADTPAGQVHKLFGIPERRSLEEIDADVAKAEEWMVELRGRHLTEAEKDIARRAAAHHRAGFNSPELGLEDLKRMGIGIEVPAQPSIGGVAIRQPDGWHGDPALVARVEDAEVAAARRQQAAMAEMGTVLGGVPR